MSELIQANSLVSIRLNGEAVPGLWQTKTGGDVTSDVTKTRRGGETKNRPVAGLPDADDITITRAFDDARDPAWMAKFKAASGWGAVEFIDQYTDGRKVALDGVLDGAVGILQGIQVPEFDNNSSDLKMVGLTISIESP
jgi:hypothetical protein